MKRTLDSLDPAAVEGKRALVRVDFNCPIKDGVVTDNTRIRAALPTIKYLRERGARVVLLSHLGRPKGGPDPKYSMQPVVRELERLLGAPVTFLADPTSEEAVTATRRLPRGGVAVGENTRFYAGEERNDRALAERFAALGDFYVNDAFGSAHRAHASTEGVARLLKPAVSGFLMQRELRYLGQALHRPKRPFLAVLGGAKISGKIDVINVLLGKVDRLLVGGAMMFTFLKAQGRPVGRSLVEDDRLELARTLLERAKEKGVELVLPTDCIASTAADGSAPAVAKRIEALTDAEMGVDIGPESQALFASRLRDAKTVVWNGPMGIFEVPAFAAGTMGVAKALAPLKAAGAVTVVGGGDSVAAVQQSGLAERFSHLSTGGGASLEFLEGKVLPGVAALDPQDVPAR